MEGVVDMVRGAHKLMRLCRGERGRTSMRQSRLCDKDEVRRRVEDSGEGRYSTAQTDATVDVSAIVASMLSLYALVNAMQCRVIMRMLAWD